jgi:hypothetical protein
MRQPPSKFMKLWILRCPPELLGSRLDRRKASPYAAKNNSDIQPWLKWKSDPWPQWLNDPRTWWLDFISVTHQYTRMSCIGSAAFKATPVSSRSIRSLFDFIFVWIVSVVILMISRREYCVSRERAWTNDRAGWHNGCQPYNSNDIA